MLPPFIWWKCPVTKHSYTLLRHLLTAYFYENNVCVISSKIKIWGKILTLINYYLVNWNTYLLCGWIYFWLKLFRIPWIKAEANIFSAIWMATTRGQAYLTLWPPSKLQLSFMAWQSNKSDLNLHRDYGDPIILKGEVNLSNDTDEMSFERLWIPADQLYP